MVGTTTDATPTRISGEDHHNEILSCLVRTNTSGQIHFGATATSSHASNERSDLAPPCSGEAGRLLSAACTRRWKIQGMTRDAVCSWTRDAGGLPLENIASDGALKLSEGDGEDGSFKPDGSSAASNFSDAMILAGVPSGPYAFKQFHHMRTRHEAMRD